MPSLDVPYAEVLENAGEVRARLDKLFARKPAGYWLDLLRSAGIWCTMVNYTVELAAGSRFWHHLQVDTEQYLELAEQALDSMLRTNDPSDRAEYVARAQVNALRAIASAVDRLASAVETHGQMAND